MIPFREEETGALARAEALEAENEELRVEIEKLKDRAGESRDAYVSRLEGQLDAAKSELAGVKLQRNRPRRSRTDQQVFVMMVVAMCFVAALFAFLMRP